MNTETDVADEKYFTKYIGYDLHQYLEDNFISTEQISCNYYDKMDCDSKFALKSSLPDMSNYATTTTSLNTVDNIFASYKTKTKAGIQ